jgi:hypothetical protein
MKVYRGSGGEQTCVREVIGSNVGRDTDYPDRCFVLFIISFR